MFSECLLIRTRKYAMRLAGMCLALLFVNVPLVYAQTVLDMRGTWTGQANELWLNCQDPGDNGAHFGNLSLTVTSQIGANFSGTAVTTPQNTGFVGTWNFSGTVAPDGNFTYSGTFSSTLNGAFDASGTLTHEGAVVGNIMPAIGTFTDTVGDTCTGEISFAAMRNGAIPHP